MPTIITISGGFHNRGPIRVKIDSDLAQELKENSCSFFSFNRLIGGLTVGQEKRVRRHMCGIRGCMCFYDHGWKVSICQK